MLNILRNLGPKGTEYYVAFSGGVDSVALAHRLIRQGYAITLLCVDHLDEWSKKEMEFTLEFAEKYNVPFLIRSITQLKEPWESKEAYWSTQRNRIFQKMDHTVLVAHNLDDAVEWYVMTSLGQGKAYIIDYKNRNILRPFILVKKKEIKAYAKKHKLKYLSDPTNADPEFNLRNKVRLSLLPEIMKVFPGVQTTVKKLLLKKLSRKKE